ncbi:bifunctional 4-hydroxy-2-oxoglutarate aldolase/2-dehydro-3-deoxy-phosphogluconate aldolase [Rhodohalobacter sp. 614A]|uniref:bifunctional 4-hydroxy-2-oxoglutarate aldolase/2-dehydro-3-deoxy-phosphogluconate aldolase n=1 Tax=Rhodohalobacter sp. 614A TaxID=2908649 RepID=UPI001F318289|nr:bifunctional 4-hydroxy-2-oxoglutarate aldolase/2-dehydro-3-deoxy-phosphogluconate aldolase [Rhodohalobacter sp. 614A]
MAQFTRLQVAQTMNDQGLVPLFYHKDTEVAKQVVKACYEGGARLLEFTNRGDFAHQIFGELVRYTSEQLPGMILGAGSVPDAATAALYMQLGANFIVTPVLRDDVGLTCNRRKVLWAPGCGTLSEIARAEELGAEIVKVFPGSQLGPGFVKAVKGPCPWTSIMPTGGVSAEEKNLRGWFEAGVSCVGMGSKLIKKSFVEAQDFQGLKTHVKNVLNTIHSIRDKK